MFQAELWGCLLGLKLAGFKGWRNVIIETDAMEIIDLPKSPLLTVYRDCETILEAQQFLNKDWKMRLQYALPEKQTWQRTGLQNLA